MGQKRWLPVTLTHVHLSGGKTDSTRRVQGLLYSATALRIWLVLDFGEWDLREPVDPLLLSRLMVVKEVLTHLPDKFLQFLFKFPTQSMRWSLVRLDRIFFHSEVGQQPINSGPQLRTQVVSIVRKRLIRQTPRHRVLEGTSRPVAPLILGAPLSPLARFVLIKRRTHCEPSPKVDKDYLRKPRCLSVIWRDLTKRLP